MTDIMEQLLASLPARPLLLSRNQEVEGKVVFFDDKEVILDLGTKSEGVLPKEELAADLKQTLKIGDTVLAFVILPENESGQVVLSSRRVSRPQVGQPPRFQSYIDDVTWQDLTQKYQQQQAFKGMVTKITQIGVFIKLENNVEGLIHSSKLTTMEGLTVGQPIQVLIDGLDQERRRISLAPVLTTTKGLIYK